MGQGRADKDLGGGELETIWSLVPAPGRRHGPARSSHEAAGSSWASQQMLGIDLGLGVLSDREEPGNQTSECGFKTASFRTSQFSSDLSLPSSGEKMFYHN